MNWYAVAPATGVQRIIPGRGLTPFERLVGVPAAFMLKPYGALQVVTRPGPSQARTRAYQEYGEPEIHGSVTGTVANGAWITSLVQMRALSPKRRLVESSNSYLVAPSTRLQANAGVRENVRGAGFSLVRRGKPWKPDGAEAADAAGARTSAATSTARARASMASGL